MRGTAAVYVACHVRVHIDCVLRGIPLCRGAARNNGRSPCACCRRNGDGIACGSPRAYGMATVDISHYGATLQYDLIPRHGARRAGPRDGRAREISVYRAAV